MRVPVALVAAFALACGFAEPSWEGSGVVRAVHPGEGRVKIEHGAIGDLMPAMTMEFELADPELAQGVEPGHFVEFRLARREERFEIVALSVPDPGSSGEAGRVSRADPLIPVDDTAPLFELVDQTGGPLSLAGLRGAPVVIDFVVTRCAGPCPIQTGLISEARGSLSAEQRARVRFVSITLDPEHDTPEVLRRYARQHRVDTEGWSFLTGSRAEVDAVARAYGVGSTPAADGSAQLEHTLVTLVVDAEGRIRERFLGLGHAPEELARAIVEQL